MSVFIFGFLISNVMPIVYRESVKHSELPIPITISHVSSIAFTGVIFGPALVGLSAETFGLTFNMYLLGIIMFAIAILMLLIMQNSEQDKNTKSKII
jgi:predicted MFS family arabinose efflux permease